MSRLKVAIVGFGSIGQRHYNNLLNITDRITVLSKRKRINVIQRTKTFKELEAYAPYDLIMICNETYKHKETVLKAITLNPKIIFVEKPLVNILADIEVIKHVLGSRRIHFMVGYSRQFFEPYLRIKKIIESGKLGFIYYFRLSVGQDLRLWRKRHYGLSYSIHKNQGGGIVIDLIHEINFPAWALNEPIKPIFSYVKKLTRLMGDIEDFNESLLVSAGGTIVSLHQDCIRQSGKWSCEIIGSKGNLSWDTDTNNLKVNIGNKLTETHIDFNWNQMFQREIKFLTNLINKKKIFSNIDEAKRDLEVVQTINEYEKKH